MEYVLIVAGGKGLRMGADIPKQFLPVGGKPVLMRTLEAFYAYNQDMRIILVLPHGRPFVSQEVIARCYALAATELAVVPVVKVVETVRRLTDAGSITVNRDEYRLVQTPQVFDGEVLKQAYSQPYTSAFTDDASVVEAWGVPVTLTEGNRENIKITTPFDLKVAAALL